jgi:hypothetical protein
MSGSYTSEGLPFASGSHESFQAARRASLTRAAKSRAYLRLLFRRGPLTDPEVSAETHWPRSSVCSIRNGVMAAGLVEKTGLTRASEYGTQCRAFTLTSAGVAAAVHMTEAA